MTAPSSIVHTDTHTHISTLGIVTYIGLIAGPSILYMPLAPHCVSISVQPPLLIRLISLPLLGFKQIASHMWSNLIY